MVIDPTKLREAAKKVIFLVDSPLLGLQRPYPSISGQKSGYKFEKKNIQNKIISFLVGNPIPPPLLVDCPQNFFFFCGFPHFDMQNSLIIFLKQFLLIIKSRGSILHCLSVSSRSIYIQKQNKFFKSQNQYPNLKRGASIARFTFFMETPVLNLAFSKSYQWAHKPPYWLDWFFNKCWSDQAQSQIFQV